jgi:type I restriction enzyme M protein
MISNKFFEKNVNEIWNINKGQSITKTSIESGIYPVIAGGQVSPYNHNEYNYQANVITISASGAYAGYVWFHDYEIFASDCTVLNSKNEKTTKIKYIFEILKLKQKEIYNLQHGSAQPHIYPRDIKSLKIPLPPLEIQTKIANHIQAIRDEAKSLQEEVKEVLESAKKEVENIILGNTP